MMDGAKKEKDSIDSSHQRSLPRTHSCLGSGLPWLTPTHCPDVLLVIQLFLHVHYHLLATIAILIRQGRVSSTSGSC